MVERYRRQKGKRKLLGSHQKCWIWGRHVVLETLSAARWPIVSLHLSERLPPSRIESARQAAQSLAVPVTIESPQKLVNRCHSGEHQGYVAKMTEYPYRRVDDILAGERETPFYAVLDSIQDPYNFGAIIRSACNLGVDALFVARKGQVPVTSLVARTSAGAVNHLAIVRVDDLSALAHQLQERGIEVAAAVPEAPAALFEFDFCRPTSVVIGNEGTGIRPGLLQACRQEVSIPQVGAVESLNAAVSASILFYEACRQRLVRARRGKPAV